MPCLEPQARSKKLRACLLCSIIQTPIDFRRNGCPNCEEIMQMKGSPDRIQACTTTHFDGSVAVVDPEKSWVARWQEQVRLKGRIPEDVEQELESQGIKYPPTRPN
ncbi:Spt4/RpoE2 zinc finger-domain-containing protein [Lactarius akahatsu]|uniref:Transcription elongation factor SPT4 n=1 Tax=Lactarius akahatsu TaxID=416441 RepID=A0AAD4QAQ4_9AGAM|nr:Spt4/RpoE2 zinc finger-domain-containing protein [Lactarius akahatsu]